MKSISMAELPNIVSLLAAKFAGTAFSAFLLRWEDTIYSVIIALLIAAAVYLGTRRMRIVPGRFQNFLELLFGGIDDFVVSVLGHRGRRHVPFLGTLFIYVFVMDLFSLVPFFKSPVSNWSVTLALALCVFVYVQFTAFKELGALGYLDHLASRPRGFLAWSIIMPVMLFGMHIIAELVRPITLSLRLRTNIWGEDLILSMLTHLGLEGLPLLFAMTLLALMTAVVQAVVFSLLAMVYLALVTNHEEAH